MTQARSELAQRAQTYLDKLNKIENAPYDLQIETAVGYRRLGDVFGNPIVPNLGKRNEAEKILKQALQDLTQLYMQQDNKANVTLALADAHFSMSGFSFIVLDNNQQAHEHAKQAETLYREYTQLHAPTVALVEKISSAMRAQSNALVWDQKGEDAIAVAKKGVKYIEANLDQQPDDTALLKEYSNTLTTLGYNTTLHKDNLRESDYGDAPNIMEKGISISRELLASDNSDRKSEALLALDLLRLGTIYYSMDQEALAMTFLNEAKQIVEKLLIIDPHDKELRRRLNSILKQSSMTVAYLSNFAQAYSFSDEYITNQNLLIESDPDNPGYYRELANGYGMRGEVAMLEGDLDKACALYQKATKQYEDVIARFKLAAETMVTERRFINNGLVKCKQD